MVRPATLGDAESIVNIYNYYVKNTTVTFEEEAVGVSEMRERMREAFEKYAWLVYETEGKVVGYAYSSAWRSRPAYRYSVEVSVYLENGLSGKGIGSALYRELLDRLIRLDLHSVIGGMALPNDACIALHNKYGFGKVAHFKEVGYKFGKWIDVVYYEKIL